MGTKEVKLLGDSFSPDAELKWLRSELYGLLRVYVDIANALLPESEGPEELVAEARRLRRLEKAVLAAAECMSFDDTASATAYYDYHQAIDEARDAGVQRNR